MALPYKHILLIGATSGIGRAMADAFVKSGIKVTAVGRRQDRLDEFVKLHGSDKAAAVPFDVAKLEEIPDFARQVTTKSPDIDCVFLNAGLNRVHDFSHPEAVDLRAFNNEILVNFSSSVALTHAFLPFLLAKGSQAGLIFTGTNLSVIPLYTSPSYSASKSALNAFLYCIRYQLRDSNVKVVDLSPPPVQTELHDAMMGEEKGRSFGMPVNLFVEEAYKGLVSGQDQIIVGSIGPADAFHDLHDKRRKTFDNLSQMMSAAH